MDKKQLLVRAISGAIFVVVMMTSIWFSPWTLSVLFGILGLLGIDEVLKLLGKDSGNAHFITYLGSIVLYGILMGGALAPEWVISYFLLIWTNDTGAYLVGSMLGKHKLAPSISPGKTWEGFIGGVLLTILVAYFISGWKTEMDVMGWAAMALIISVFGTLGDLVESQMKRNAGVKDSGNLMPGHGGVLDRFDGVFISLPLVYFCLQFFIQ